MSLTQMLYNAPLYQPVKFPPPKSNVIILCSNDDIKYIPEVFKEYNIKLVISDKPSSEKIILDNDAIQVDYDLQKIFNYQNCHIIIFSHRWDYDILLRFSRRLFKLNIRYKYICMPVDGRYQPCHPNFFIDSRDELEKIFNLLCDDESREIFVSRIKSIIMGTIGYIRQSEYDDYFHPETIPHKGDIVIDGGVGPYIHLVKKYSKHVGNNGHVYCFEPACYFDVLDKFTDINNATLFQHGLWNKLEDQIFKVSGLGSHVVNEHSDSTITSKMTTIDAFMSECNINKVDIIKLDVEGSEKNVLLGGIDTIIKHRPKLLICVYHKLNDLFELPLFIHELDLNYKFYLGHHRPILMDTVLYAVPN